MRIKTKPRLFKMEVSVKISEQSVFTMDKLPEIAFSVRENIPVGIHPVDYVRQRLGEEIKRHASQTTIQTKEPITTSSELSE